MNCLKALWVVLPVAALAAGETRCEPIVAADSSPPDPTPQQIAAFRAIKTVRLVVQEEYQDCPGKTVPRLHDWPQTAIETMGIKVVEGAEAPADATLEVRAKGTYTKGVVDLQKRPFEPEALYNEVVTRVACSLTLRAGKTAYTRQLPDASSRCTSTGEIDPWQQMERIVPEKELVRSIIQMFSAFRAVDKVKVLIALLRFDKEGYGFSSGGGVICSLDKNGRWHCTPFDRGLRANLGPFVEEIQQIGADAVQPLCEALRSDTVAIRRGAARALGAIGDARAVGPLLAVMKDRDRSVARAATTALGKMRGEQVFTSLIEALKDEDSLVAWAAAEALGETGDRRAVEPLIEMLKKPYRGWPAAAALTKIPDARAVEPLIQALQSGDLMLRDRAAEALGKIRDRRAVEPLMAALRDKDGSVRHDAAESLGEIGDRKAVEALIPALADKDLSVRSRVIDALVKIGDPRAVPALLARMTDDDWAIARQDAAEAAVRLDPKAIDAIVNVLKNPDPRLRWEATQWLGRLGDGAVLAALKQTAEKDPEEAVRDGAKKAIEEIQKRRP